MALLGEATPRTSRLAEMTERQQLAFLCDFTETDGDAPATAALEVVTDASTVAASPAAPAAVSLTGALEIVTDASTVAASPTAVSLTGATQAGAEADWKARGCVSAAGPACWFARASAPPVGAVLWINAHCEHDDSQVFAQ